MFNTEGSMADTQPIQEYSPPTQEIVKLNALLDNNLNLEIPDYQRPYKWTEKNVIQLLEDIWEFTYIRKKDFRIGNIILHEDKDTKKNYIVDGQQRLITISILLYLLDKENDNVLLLNKKIKDNAISTNNIVSNYRVIDRWIRTKLKDEDKKYFKSEMLNKCELILFNVYEQEEAFQLFDAQNARGKPLEPYDLLKAFHLREMESDSEEEREKCVERWEKSISNGNLKPILGNHLFRIRKWSKNEYKYNFTKDEIDEFKGVSLKQTQKYPYETAIRMLDGLFDDLQRCKILINLNVAQNFPFQITSPIINGKRFFEYVDYYINLREQIFDLNREDEIKAKLNNFVQFYIDYCFGYSGWSRSGDEKVRNLFENIMIAFIDKFGFMHDDFINIYKAFYKLAYILRCEKNRITVETIIHSEAIKVFNRISNSLSPADLIDYQFKRYNKENERNVEGIEKICKFIYEGIENGI